MPKHPRKKQKTVTDGAQPLGSRDPNVDDDAEKDDEERRLESVLFGKPFVAGSSKRKEIIVVDEEGVNNDEVGGGAAFEQLEDKDLFFMDDAVPGVTEDISNLLTDEDHESDHEQSEDEVENDSEVERSKDQDEQTEEHPKESTVEQSTTKTRKKAAWVDPDDATLKVSLSNNKRLRKLRDAEAEDVVGGTQYEAKLRREFERINPQPEWAADARKKAQAKKRRRSSLGADGEGAMDVDDLLTRSNGILQSRDSRVLEKGTISIERLRDANQSAKAEGEIKSLQFHPSPNISVMLTASSDRRLRLFNVDGHTNPHVLTVHVPSLPLSNAIFHPSGSTVLMTGPRPFYYTVDLQAGTTTRSPRGLWGASFTSSNAAKDADHSMETCAFNTSGDILAVAGRRGYVHLVDWRSGAAQVVGQVKMNSPVRALWWSRGSGRQELLTLSDDAEVYLWDVAERRCVRRWRDDGGYGSLTISGDPAGKYLGIGSKSGIVNVYGSDALLTDFEGAPKVMKTLGNLTTAISTLQFNHDSQLLAMASNRKKDQMRLVHLPSLTAYSNWPTSSTPLGHVTAIDFSKGSEYLAIGNNRGRVLLYQLSHFVS